MGDAAKMTGERVPTLRQVVGAMIFGGNRPLTVREIRTCLAEMEGENGEDGVPHRDVTPAQVKAVLTEIEVALRDAGLGFLMCEVAGGFRLQSDPSSGPWLRRLLNRKSNRLSRPALETLAIVACRQPVAKAEIERIRGVSVDHIIKMLMEMQLVKIVGRSELPGRPFLYGTTHSFLEHFGLSDLKTLEQLGVAADYVGSRGVDVAPADEVDEEDDREIDDGADDEDSDDEDNDDEDNDDEDDPDA